jgi:hypothetical protein
VIKSFVIEFINDDKSIDENVQSINDNVQSSDYQNNLSTEFFEIIKFTSAKRLSLRYQNFADIIVFLQDENSHSNQFEDVLISTFLLIFMKSRRKEIND